MNPEKFNPSDPKYKKVEDLPKKHQAEFVDISEDVGGGSGFVRKEAFENLVNAEHRAEKYNEDLVRKIGRLLHISRDETPIAVLYDNALEEKEARKPIEGFESGLVLQELDTLESREDKIAFASEKTRDLMNYVTSKIQRENNEKARAGLQELGHKGLLYLAPCKVKGDDGGSCEHLFGTLDGGRVSVHSNTWTEIYGGPTFSPEEGRRLVNAYRGVAIKGRKDYNGKFTRGDSTDEYINRELASGEVINESILETFNELLRGYNVLLEEIRKENEEQDRPQERHMREVEKREREEAINKRIGYLMPKDSKRQ